MKKASMADEKRKRNNRKIGRNVRQQQQSGGGADDTNDDELSSVGLGAAAEQEEDDDGSAAADDSEAVSLAAVDAVASTIEPAICLLTGTLLPAAAKIDRTSSLSSLIYSLMSFVTCTSD